MLVQRPCAQGRRKTKTKCQRLKEVTAGPRVTNFQPLTLCRARTPTVCGTAGCFPIKGLQIRVWSGSWSPHSNHCSALASLRAVHTADRTVSFRPVATQRQLVSRARQPGRTKNRRRSCRIRRERPRASSDTRPQQRRAIRGVLRRLEGKW